jgi:hypothetical protein
MFGGPVVKEPETDHRPALVQVPKHDPIRVETSPRDTRRRRDAHGRPGSDVATIGMLSLLLSQVHRPNRFVREPSNTHEASDRKVALASHSANHRPAPKIGANGRAD